MIDAHRQFIWGFSLNKFKNNPLLGYGPDTSNFINDSQKIIGHEETGDMTFIPSHPHNFFIEILLRTWNFRNFFLYTFYIIYKLSNFTKCK